MIKCQKCKIKEENESLKMEIAGMEAALKMIVKEVAAKQKTSTKQKPNPDYVPPPSKKKDSPQALTDFIVKLQRKIDFYREREDLDRISVLCNLEQDMFNFMKECERQYRPQY